MIDYIGILSGVAIVIFIVSALPQIWTIWKHKSARDVSLWMSLLIATGNLLGLVRAVAIRDTFFTVNYGFQLILWLAIVFLVLKYRNK